MTFSREHFYVGGNYSGPPADVMHGQMYVEVLKPDSVLHPHPLVLIHGNGQTGTNWLTTPDGRKGWAQWFAEQGWEVYVVDQPARGRSAWQPSVHQAPTSLPVSVIERMFTAPADFGLWPQAKLHTQWPGGIGKGRAGDPVFDQFYASQVPSLGRADAEAMMLSAGAGLLEKIGPAFLIAHSQAGALAWLLADARPSLVEGIVALEPTGPPFRDVLDRGQAERSWGLTSSPLTYEPPVTQDEPLEFEQETAPDEPGLAACWRQRGDARQFVHLAEIPVLLVTGEASYHAAYDHCTVQYLQAAGVAAEHCELGKVGIRGNGHMMMMELNNLEIASVIGDWLKSMREADFTPS